MVKMKEFLGEMVPEELCTVDRFGDADDFDGCGKCFDNEETADCDNCVVNKIFQEYANLTGQNKNTGFDPKKGCIAPDIGGDGAVWVLHGYWNVPDDTGVNVWAVSPDLELLQKQMHMISESFRYFREIEYESIEESETKYEAESSKGYFIRIYITLKDVAIGKGRHK